MATRSRGTAAAGRTRGVDAPKGTHQVAPPTTMLVAAEVAALLRLSVREVYRQARAGRLPHVAFGARSIRFPRAEIEAIAEGRQP